MSEDVSTNSNRRTYEVPEVIKTKNQNAGIPESFFLSAYDNQIQLVERLVLDHKEKDDDIAKLNKSKKKKTKGTQSSVRNTQNDKTSDDRGPANRTDHTDDKSNVTHRSRIYRYEGTNETSSTSDNVDYKDPIFVPPPLDTSKVSMNDEVLHNTMLASWYKAGYHTGYYEAMKKFKRSCSHCDS